MVAAWCVFLKHKLHLKELQSDLDLKQSEWFDHPKLTDFHIFFGGWMAEAGHLRETPQVDGAGAEEPALGRLGSGSFKVWETLIVPQCVKSREVPRFTRWVVSTFSPFLPLSSHICFGLKIILQQQHSKRNSKKKTQLVATYGSIGISPVYPQYIPSSAAAATRPSEGQLGEACGLRGEGGSLLLGRPGWRAPGPLVGGAMGHHGAPICG